ncbi:hypothetical protein V1512DRAFT_242571 [Lipomyces arxii]|uniref:uncharacterized protein n=1 Tax=Lipomyces arxii TaxID=56418 RepID=UPI0034CF34D3
MSQPKDPPSPPAVSSSISITPIRRRSSRTVSGGQRRQSRLTTSVTTKGATLLYSASQQGQLDDFESSELLVQKLNSFQYDEPVNRSQEQSQKSTQGSQPTTRKMVQLSRFNSKSLNSLSKKNPRSISARVAAAFKVSDRASSSTPGPATSIALTGKSAEREQQRLFAFSNILGPEDAIERCKRLRLKFPFTLSNSDILLSNNAIASLSLYTAAFRGIEPEMDELGYLSWEGRELAQRTQIEVPRTPSPERSLHSYSLKSNQVRDENEEMVYDTDNEYIASSPLQEQSLILLEDPLASVTEPQRHEVIDILASDGSGLPSSPGVILNRVLLPHISATTTTESMLSDTTDTGTEHTILTASVMMLPERVQKQSSLVEVPDSEDDEGFASDVDVHELLRDSTQEDRQARELKSTTSGSDVSPLIGFASRPALLQKQRAVSSPNVSTRSMATRSTPIKTPTKARKAAMLEKAEQSPNSPKTPTKRARAAIKEPVSQTVYDEAELKKLKVAGLREILSSWGFKAPKLKSEMIVHILHYQSKMSATQLSDTMQLSPTSNQAKLMDTVQIRKKLLANISRYIRTAESAKQWWIKILSYEPLELPEFAKFLVSEHVLDGDVDDIENKTLALVRDWCDISCVCFQESASGSWNIKRKRKPKKARKATAQ